MRVLLVCRYLPPEKEDGGSMTVYALARALVERGVGVSVLKARYKEPLPDDAWPGLDVHQTDFRDRFDYRERGIPDFYAHTVAKAFNHRSYRRAIRELASRERFDLIHAQDHTTALAAVSLKGEVDLPVAATLRGHGLWCFVLGRALPDRTPCTGCVTANQLVCAGCSGPVPNPVRLPKVAIMKAWTRFQTRLARSIDLMIPISTMMAGEAEGYNRPMRIIPDLVRDVSGPPAAALPAAVVEALARRAPGERVALYAGRLAPNKGVDSIVEAASHVSGWRFLIAGDDPQGDYGPSLVERARALGLSNVDFLGWVPNASMPALYDAADAVLLPFLRLEPLSSGMVEALARGRALAATAQGGPLDAVEDGANGVLFEPSAGGLVGALDRLAGMDLDALGGRSREIFETRFHPDRVLDAHLEAYRWLVARGETGR